MREDGGGDQLLQWTKLWTRRWADIKPRSLQSLHWKDLGSLEGCWLCSLFFLYQFVATKSRFVVETYFYQLKFHVNLCWLVNFHAVCCQTKHSFVNCKTSFHWWKIHLSDSHSSPTNWCGTPRRGSEPVTLKRLSESQATAQFTAFVKGWRIVHSSDILEQIIWCN